MFKQMAIILTLLIVLIGTASASQNRSTPVTPAKLEAMRNLGLETSKSGFPVTLPRAWGRLISVQRSDPDAYTLFLENNGGEIFLVRLIQRGNYLYLDTYDQGGVALVIGRN
jgi:hypothetical protein